MARQNYVGAYRNQHEVKYIMKYQNRKNGLNRVFSCIFGIQHHKNEQISNKSSKDEDSKHFSSLMSSLASDHMMAREGADIFHAYDAVSDYLQ